MFIFIVGIILGFLCTFLYRKRMGIYNVGLKRIGLYLVGSAIAFLYSSILVALCTLVAPKEFYPGKTEMLASIQTVERIEGDFHAGFGHVESEFFYRCHVIRNDRGYYSIEIPSSNSIVYEDVSSSNAQVRTIYVTNPGLWKMLTWPEDKIYAYVIHVPPQTILKQGSIR